MRSDSIEETDWDVVIAGAGPIGMVLATLLILNRFRVLILEKRPARSALSRAIGVTPPSLRILAALGLDRRCIAAGLPIQHAVVHGRSRIVGDLDFHDLPGDHPYILSLPQSELEGILEQHLGGMAGVEIRRDAAVTGYEDLGDRVRVSYHHGDGRTVTARWLVACDGAGSPLRTQAGIASPKAPYPCRFAMADFVDRSGLNDEAHLYFSREGTIESFPLPCGKRRWIAQIVGETPAELETSSALNLEAIRRRTGWAPAEDDRVCEWSAFQPQRLLSDAFHRGNVILCGDAAHVMSPIGGQGMNTGFGDAWDLTTRLCRIRAGRDQEAELSAYARFRRRAFLHASDFAALCMWIGTRRGPVSGRIRDGLTRHLLRLRPMRRFLALRFAMLTGPRREALEDPAPAEPGETGQLHWQS